MLERIKEQLLTQGEAEFKVKVRANAQADKVKGERGEALKIDIKAPAEKGKANKELKKFLARQFRISANNVTIVAGEANNSKIIKITG